MVQQTKSCFSGRNGIAIQLYLNICPLLYQPDKNWPVKADEVNIDPPAIRSVSITDARPIMKTHSRKEWRLSFAHRYAVNEKGYNSRERSSKTFITSPGTAIRTKAKAVRKASIAGDSIVILCAASPKNHAIACSRAGRSVQIMRR